MSRITGPCNLIDGGKRIGIRCPGCDDVHVLNVDPASGRPCWGFDGNHECPTFTPSLLVKTGSAVDPKIIWEDGDPPLVCHSFIRAGSIEFLSDSTHALAGQTVPLPPFSWGAA